MQRKKKLSQLVTIKHCPVKVCVCVCVWVCVEGGGLSTTLQLHQAPIAAFPETSMQQKISSYTPTPKHTHTHKM